MRTRHKVRQVVRSEGAEDIQAERAVVGVGAMEGKTIAD